MSFKNYAFYDKIILSKPVTVKGFTFISVIGITIQGYGKYGVFLWGTITPKALIIIDSSGDMSFYKISNDTATSELLESITLLFAEE